MYSLPSFPIFCLASSHRGSKNRAGKPQWIRKVSDNSRELYGNQRIMGFLPIRVHLCGRFTAATLSDCSDLLKPRLRAQRVGCCLPHKTTSSALNKNEIKVILGLFFHTSLPPSISLSSQDKEEQWMTKLVPGANDFAMLQPLQWNTRYEVEITARNVKGLSEPTFYQFFMPQKPDITGKSTIKKKTSCCNLSF